MGIEGTTIQSLIMQDKSLPGYAWWASYKAIWELKEAANLYLGFIPDKGGTFYTIDNLIENHAHGMILTDAETLWSIEVFKDQNKLEWHDVFDKDEKSKISLEEFVKDRIRIGEITVFPKDSGLYFKPIEIISLFQKHFLNTPPQELLKAIGLYTPKNSKSFVAPKGAAAHEASYQMYHNEQIALYLEEKIQKPWAAQDKEEVIVAQRMAEGFDRIKFREARKKILAVYPNSGKTRLSTQDYLALKAFVSKDQKIS